MPHGSQGPAPPLFRGCRVPLLLGTLWAAGPMLKQLGEGRGHLFVQWRSLYIATQAAYYHTRLLTPFPLAQLTYKSGLLRQHQFLFPVLLLSSTKPHHSSPWPLLTHEGQTPTLPRFHSWSRIKTFPQSYSKLDFPVFYLQHVP